MLVSYKQTLCRCKTWISLVYNAIRCINSRCYRLLLVQPLLPITIHFIWIHQIPDVLLSQIYRIITWENKIFADREPLNDLRARSVLPLWQQRGNYNGFIFARRRKEEKNRAKRRKIAWLKPWKSRVLRRRTTTFFPLFIYFSPYHHSRSDHSRAIERSKFLSRASNPLVSFSSLCRPHCTTVLFPTARL